MEKLIEYIEDNKETLTDQHYKELIEGVGKIVVSKEKLYVMEWLEAELKFNAEYGSCIVQYTPRIGMYRWKSMCGDCECLANTEPHNWKGGQQFRIVDNALIIPENTNLTMLTPLQDCCNQGAEIAAIPSRLFIKATVYDKIDYD